MPCPALKRRASQPRRPASALYWRSSSCSCCRRATTRRCAGSDRIRPVSDRSRYSSAGPSSPPSAAGVAMAGLWAGKSLGIAAAVGNESAAAQAKRRPRSGSIQPDRKTQRWGTIVLREQFRQGADDPVGADWRIRRQADAIAVIPDRIDAEPLRRDHLPFEIVANHPGVVRRDPKRGERVTIGLLLRLAEAVLALDLDVVEAVLQCETHDLLALRLGGAVGDERELDSESLQPVQRLVRAGKHAQFGFLDLVEAVGDRVEQFRRRHWMTRVPLQLRKGIGDDVAARLADAVAPILVARLVGPEVARIGLDRSDDIGRLVRRQLFGEGGDDPVPLFLALAKGAEDRVVEVEQDSLGQLVHAAQAIACGACGTVCQNSGSWPKKIRAPPASSAASRSSDASIASLS